MSFKSKEFKDLSKEWAKKLKKSGFEDIETSDGNLRVYDSYKLFQSGPRHCMTPDWIAAKESYYRSAEHFLNRHVFNSPVERKIWALHSEGVSIRNILKVVKSKSITNKSIVHQIVRKLVKEMKDSWKLPE